MNRVPSPSLDSLSLVGYLRGVRCVVPSPAVAGATVERPGEDRRYSLTTLVLNSNSSDRTDPLVELGITPPEATLFHRVNLGAVCCSSSLPELAARPCYSIG